MERARIAGTGLTHFGATPDRTCRELFAEAGLAALEDAGVGSEVVEAVHVGNFMAEIADDQGHLGPLAADAVGVQAPATRYENACASAGAALRHAVTDIRAGVTEIALIGGVERMTNLETEHATAGLALAADALQEVRAGVTFPGAYALMADAYFDRYGGDREALAHVAVKNHRHGVDNEYAQFQRTVTVEEILEAPMVADPLSLFDACPFTDGAAALVLASDAAVAEHGLDAPVAVTGTGQGGDTLSLQDRESLVETPAAATAARSAYEDAGVGPADLDVAEVHDCFTIAEVLALEALGVYDPGTAIDAASSGETTRGGRLPTNLSGGLKAKGHPVGATGAAQVIDVTKALVGERGRDLDATVGVAHNAGGAVASATVHVLEAIADP